MGMTGFGPSIASSLAGAPQTERAAVARTSRDDRKRARLKKALHTDSETVVDKVELTDAVRNLKDNAQEETHEDRQEHTAYSPAGQRRADTHQPPQLDLQG